ncbi:Hpt domain-containing protein [Lachnospiraceae bacterium C10]|jgi:HPt (histidine-containing phosphotransfer) domain-containing protein|nr:Hpt domain-containing protein [Lachnospiraceae bacterium C10]SDW71685.1 Hpt domain-containing protein [Lachnospiraceae bacterium KHCPX20]
MTIDNLKAYGADTDTGLSRCVGNEALYLKLVKMMIEDKNFALLENAIIEGDLNSAFEIAHALKGTTGNLALTPLYDEICEIVEPLRRREDHYDYSSQYQMILTQLHRLSEFAGL